MGVRQMSNFFFFEGFPYTETRKNEPLWFYYLCKDKIQYMSKKLLGLRYLYLAKELYTVPTRGGQLHVRWILVLRWSGCVTPLIPSNICLVSTTVKQRLRLSQPQTASPASQILDGYYSGPGRCLARVRQQLDHGNFRGWLFCYNNAYFWRKKC